MKDSRKKLKICLAASAGGHLTQLLKLSDCWQDYESFYVSTTEVVRKNLNKYGRVYIVGECNHQHLFRTIKVFLRSTCIVFREKPDVVLSTGAAAGCIMCFLGKLFGAKIIWIDSITNVERPSLSGRMVRYITDLFLTQWPGIAENYNNVEYAGTVI